MPICVGNIFGADGSTTPWESKGRVSYKKHILTAKRADNKAIVINRFTLSSLLVRLFNIILITNYLEVYCEARCLS